MQMTVTETAKAKINLALHVTGRRADGYHLLDSLVAFADFGDELTLGPGDMSLRITGPFGTDLVGDHQNLCWRAAQQVGVDAAMVLTKNLPVASGIGGGSADAAAVLRALTRLGHDLPQGLDRLGADIPVCIRSRPARMQGIGDIVTPLDVFPGVDVVLVNPGHEVSTPKVFHALQDRENPPLPTIPHLSDAGTLIGWLRQTRNDLEPPARRILPQITEVIEALTHGGAGFVRMSGSGATCFGLFSGRAQARKAAADLSRHGWWAVATQLVSAGSAR